MKLTMLFVLPVKATVLPIVLMPLLTACGQTATREEAIANLDGAPVCCQSLSEIQYAPFPSNTSEFIYINEQSPAVVFDKGKSHFVAFKLPDHPLPYRLSLKSYPVGPSPKSATILMPEMTILDADYNVLLTSAPHEFRFTRISFSEEMKDFKVSFSNVITNRCYRGDFIIDNARARYVLIYTTDENLYGEASSHYMGYVDVYTGTDGVFVPVPTGEREARIGHSAYGAIRFELTPVEAPPD